MFSCGASIFPSWAERGGGLAPSTLLNGLVSYWSLDETSGTRKDSVVAIGLLADSAERCMSAAGYLTKHSMEAVA